MQAGKPAWKVGGFIGTSEAMIRKHYGHHSPDGLRDTAEVATRRPPNAKVAVPLENLIGLVPPTRPVASPKHPPQVADLELPVVWLRKQVDERDPRVRAEARMVDQGI